MEEGRAVASLAQAAATGRTRDAAAGRRAVDLGGVTGREGEGKGGRRVLHGLGHGDGEDRHRSSVRPAARGPRRWPDLARRPRRRPDLSSRMGVLFFRRDERGRESLGECLAIPRVEGVAG